MKTTQAIETAYHGYRFRSRLEARWAVFFDALGIAYEYEREGYELGIAGRYLPDFWLPAQQSFVEIKAVRPSPEEVAKAKMLAFVTERPVYILINLPKWDKDTEKLYLGYRVDFEKYEFSRLHADPDFFPWEDALEDPDEYGGWLKLEQMLNDSGAVIDTGAGSDLIAPAGLLVSCTDFEYHAARTACLSARFEFGQAFRRQPALTGGSRA